MLSHPAHPIALGSAAALSPMAPGTVGTLWAWLRSCSAGAAQRSAMGRLLGGGWWSAGGPAPSPRAISPSPTRVRIVWDEIIAFWAVLWLVTPAGLWTQFVAFALFDFSMRQSRGRSPGPTSASRADADGRSAGHRASASSSTISSLPCARCS
jgi:phosphatidylglycerophosphatase A